MDVLTGFSVASDTTSPYRRIRAHAHAQYVDMQTGDTGDTGLCKGEEMSLSPHQEKELRRWLAAIGEATDKWSTK